MTSAPQPSKKVKPNKIVTRSQSRNNSHLQSLIDSHEREVQLLRQVRKAESENYYSHELCCYLAGRTGRLLRQIKTHLRTARKVERGLHNILEQQDNQTRSSGTTTSDLKKSVSQLSSSIDNLSEEYNNSFTSEDSPNA